MDSEVVERSSHCSRALFAWYPGTHESAFDPFESSCRVLNKRCVHEHYEYGIRDRSNNAQHVIYTTLTFSILPTHCQLRHDCKLNGGYRYLVTSDMGPTACTVCWTCSALSSFHASKRLFESVHSRMQTLQGALPLGFGRACPSNSLLDCVRPDLGMIIQLPYLTNSQVVILR